MKHQAGLWIDHRRAVVVSLTAEGEEIQHVTSDMEKRVRYSGASQSQTQDGHADSSEDHRDRRFDEHLDKYYDEVIASLHDAASVVILGPGEAKTEFQKRLGQKEGHPQIVAIEASDKMTDGQIVAAVKQHYLT